jgi:hypothetical protein
MLFQTLRLLEERSRLTNQVKAGQTSYEGDLLTCYMLDKVQAKVKQERPSMEMRREGERRSFLHRCHRCFRTERKGPGSLLLKEKEQRGQSGRNLR